MSEINIVNSDEEVVLDQIQDVFKYEPFLSDLRFKWVSKDADETISVFFDKPTLIDDGVAELVDPFWDIEEDSGNESIELFNVKCPSVEWADSLTERTKE